METCSRRFSRKLFFVHDNFVISDSFEVVCISITRGKRRRRRRRKDKEEGQVSIELEGRDLLRDWNVESKSKRGSLGRKKIWRGRRRNCSRETAHGGNPRDRLSATFFPSSRVWKKKKKIGIFTGWRSRSAGWKRLISRSTVNYAGTNKAFVVSESRDKVCLRAIALRFPPCLLQARGRR